MNGVPVFIHSVKKFAGLASKENYILTVNSRDRELFLRELEKYSLDDRITVVNGGASRVESVRNALDAVNLLITRSRALASNSLSRVIYGNTSSRDFNCHVISHLSHFR